MDIQCDLCDKKGKGPCNRFGCDNYCCNSCLEERGSPDEPSQFCKDCVQKEDEEQKRENDRIRIMNDEDLDEDGFANNYGGMNCESCQDYHEEEYCPYKN
eukprot:TRINITY_DN4622_c1_g3_i1.p1 TRINITY_DN4622_c1_g3~~TRINITY_DN4622_c1_g3_i1.p1  ORF type:complete len:100 (+),score=18.88 TRINITY_DN4622_c1_g3_i1:154-453(+)